jgi:hypothetical protein
MLGFKRFNTAAIAISGIELAAKFRREKREAGTSFVTLLKLLTR